MVDDLPALLAGRCGSLAELGALARPPP